VLAVVMTGLTIGWYAPERFSPAFRIPANAVWRMVTFVLNGLVFLLIGLHFPALLQRMHPYSVSELLKLSALVSLTAILVRIAWVYIVAYGTRFLIPAIRRKDPYPPWQNVFIIAWVGMRGVVSLATALALPLTIYDGSPFPHRDLIIFLAFTVILVTLMLQGLPLPWITRQLALIYDGTVLQEQWTARRLAADNAMKKLENLRQDTTIQSEALERIIGHYRHRIELLGDGPNTPLDPKEPPTMQNHPLIVNESRIWREVLEAERDAIVCLRQTFEISDDVMHEMLQDIDFLHNHYAGHV
jgi:CPA1 family monovalent cation:H+ antiporter